MALSEITALSLLHVFLTPPAALHHRYHHSFAFQEAEDKLASLRSRLEKGLPPDTAQEQAQKRKLAMQQQLKQQQQSKKRPSPSSSSRPPR